MLWICFSSCFFTPLVLRSWDEERSTVGLEMSRQCMDADWAGIVIGGKSVHAVRLVWGGGGWGMR